MSVCSTHAEDKDDWMMAMLLFGAFQQVPKSNVGRTCVCSVVFCTNCEFILNATSQQGQDKSDLFLGPPLLMIKIFFLPVLLASVRTMFLFSPESEARALFVYIGKKCLGALAALARNSLSLPRHLLLSILPSQGHLNI
jgi:hypothetical protein